MSHLDEIRFNRIKLSDVPNDLTVLVTYNPKCPKIDSSTIHRISSGADLDWADITPIAITPLLMRHILDKGGRRIGNADIYPYVDMWVGNVQPPTNVRGTWICRLFSHGVEVVTPRLLHKSVMEDARIAWIRFHYQMQQGYLK